MAFFRWYRGQAFVRAVANGRDVPTDDVRRGFGQGWVLGAKAAVEERMADRIGTLDDTVSRRARAKPVAGMSQAEVDAVRARAFLL